MGYRNEQESDGTWWKDNSGDTGLLHVTYLYNYTVLYHGLDVHYSVLQKNHRSVVSMLSKVPSFDETSNANAVVTAMRNLPEGRAAYDEWLVLRPR